MTRHRTPSRSLRTLLLLGAGLLLAAGSIHALTGDGQLVLSFERLTPARKGFTVVARLVDQAGRPLTFADTPRFAAVRGSLSPTQTRTDGSFAATVTPDRAFTGEYPITVRSAQAPSVTHTAVVLEEVHPGWGQPLKVEGDVNTAGTEDSIGVSPDGAWLFLQYYPATISCRFVNKRKNRFCTMARGPFTAPQRPHLPGGRRISAAGSIHNGCAPYGFDPAPIIVLPTGIYGFHRQANGSFAEPFVFYFKDSNGCMSPHGPDVTIDANGRTTMYLSLRKSIVAVHFTPGRDVRLGRITRRFKVVEPHYRKFGPVVHAHQGNPSVWRDQHSDTTYLFWDNERKRKPKREIYFSQRVGGGRWSAPTTLPSPPFHPDREGEIQPFFDGRKMVLRRGNRLVLHRYHGGPIEAAVSWSPEEVLLRPQRRKHRRGSVYLIGEPTIARVGAAEVLYFVYGLINPNDDNSINLQVGSITRSTVR